MKSVTIHEAKTHLSQILRKVEAGETFLVLRGKTPVAQLVPFQPSHRRFDGAKGLIVSMADDFDSPEEDFIPYMAAEDTE